MQPELVNENGSQYDGGGNISVGDLATKRTTELQAFLIALESAVLRREVEDDDTFVMLIQLAIDDYGIGQAEVAEILQTTTSTVGRWKQGRAVPSGYSRPGIVSAISTLLSKHINDRS